jgi:hypothetical protein
MEEFAIDTRGRAEVANTSLLVPQHTGLQQLEVRHGAARRGVIMSVEGSAQRRTCSRGRCASQQIERSHSCSPGVPSA